MLGMTKI